MLGIFNLLPILKGWEYKEHVITSKSVVRGAAPLELLRLSERGLVYAMAMLTDDAYGTFTVSFQGADLQTITNALYPEAFRVLGAFVQDPAGWLQRYLRPNPYSTQGVYSLISTGGYQGSTYPYYPTIVSTVSLPTNSTQATAEVTGTANVVAITNLKAFVTSLRRVLRADSYKYVDEALLVTGPAEFEKLKDLEEKLSEERA